jgi:hypothetical protein
MLAPLGMLQASSESYAWTRPASRASPCQTQGVAARTSSDEFSVALVSNYQ